MRWTTIAAALSLLGGCAYFQSETRRGHEETGAWTVPMSFTTADVRFVSLRKHPVLGNEVICAEPSPDVANALSAVISLTAAYEKASAGGSVTTSEAAAELAGRSTALLGLRDGLFRACEAYANGTIGQNAYALIIGRYSQLMTTLFLGQDLSGTAVANAKASVTPGPAAPPGNKDGKISAPGAVTPPPPAPNPPGTPVPAPAAVTDAAAAAEAAVWAAVAATAARAAGSHPAVTPPAPAQQVAGTITPTMSPPPAKDPSDSTTSNVGSATEVPGLALTRMNEDFLHDDMLDIVLVSCINEEDPTRFRKEEMKNGFLERICRDINWTDLKQAIADREKAAAQSQVDLSQSGKK